MGSSSATSKSLPAVRTGRLRAAAISAAGHVCVFALLVLVAAGDGPPARPSMLINAEIITSRAPEVPEPTGLAPSEPVAPLTPTPQPAAPVVPETRTEPVPTPEVSPEPPASEPVRETPPADPREPESVAELAPPEPAVAAADGVSTDTSAAVATPPPAPPTAEPQPEAPADQVLRRRLASWTGQFSVDEPEPTVTWREGGQTYTAVLRRVAATDAMGMERLVAAVTTERDGQPFATELTMTRMAFSSFAQFVDRWDPNVGLHDDVIDGRFHSNSEIKVHRERGVQPTFRGKVTVAARQIQSDGFLNRQKLFPAGLEMNVRRIGLPKRDTAIDTDALPSGQVHRFEHDAEIVFHADGSFASSPYDGAFDGERRALGEEPFYLVAADEVTLRVRGTVNGQVLVYSPATILIVDDLTYADDPRTEGAGDYLGLVAERTVEIAESQVTGDGDLTVHASIYARHRFAVRGYRSRRNGTLAIVGSVTAGSVSATEPRYATAVNFDTRLATLRAPGFPLSDRYELDEWNGEWRPVEAP